MPLHEALAEIRAALLDETGLRRAIAAGHRRGALPSVTRARLRPVLLKQGPHLQVVTSDGARPITRNVPWGRPARKVVDELLAEPFGNWRVETAGGTLQLRVTKRGEARLHRSATAAAVTPDLAHDRLPGHVVDPSDPLFDLIGGSAAKRRQVDAFLRALAATLGNTGWDLSAPGRAVLARGPAVLEAPGPVIVEPVIPEPARADRTRTGLVPAATRAADGTHRPRPHQVDPGRAATGPAGRRRTTPSPFGATADDRPVTVVDFGCGNAYLTFAAYRYLTATVGADVELVGVDVREDQRERNTDLAAKLGWADRVRFVAGTIASADVPPADMVLALHACDTATDEALARAVRWRSRYVLAAPCCHRDVAAQLRTRPAPGPYPLLTAAPILRERYADVLTDALRAALLRLHGYQVHVVEFVDSRHTPRNLLLRARYTGAPATPELRDRYAQLTGAWGVTPALERLLAEPD